MPKAILYLIFFVPFTLLMSSVAIVGTFLDGTGAFAHRCALFWSRWGLRFAGIRVKASGIEHVPTEGPVIFMANHQGNFDILALTLSIPRRFSWMAKEELFRIPFFGAAMRRAGYIPINRGDGRQALQSLNEAAQRIRGGISVIVFPEGTRTKDGSLLPFKKGGFVLASRAGVPVVPVTINGSRAINPRNQIRLNPGTISITFSQPITTESVSRDELQARVRESIQAELIP